MLAIFLSIVLFGGKTINRQVNNTFIVGEKKTTSALALWYLYLLHVNIVIYGNSFVWWQEHPFAGIEKTVVSSCSSSDQSSLNSSKQQHLHSFHWSQIFQRVSARQSSSFVQESKKELLQLWVIFIGEVWEFKRRRLLKEKKERKKGEKMFFSFTWSPLVLLLAVVSMGWPHDRNTQVIFKQKSCSLKTSVLEEQPSFVIC